MLTTRKVLAFSFIIVISLLMTIWINSARINNKSYETNKFQLKPVYTNTLWGAKLISWDGTHNFFAGIQKGETRLDYNDNLIIHPKPKLCSNSNQVKNHQIKIKLNLGKIDVFLKILSYSQTALKSESPIQSRGETITQLNYIKKNSPCKKRNKNNFVLLNKTIPDKPYSKSVKESKTISVFALLIQIIPK